MILHGVDSGFRNMGEVISQQQKRFLLYIFNPTRFFTLIQNVLQLSGVKNIFSEYWDGISWMTENHA